MPGSVSDSAGQVGMATIYNPGQPHSTRQRCAGRPCACLLLALVLFGKLLLGVDVGGHCLGLAFDLPVGQASQCGAGVVGLQAGSGAVARGHLLVGAAGHVGDQDFVVVLSISTRTCCGAMLDVGFQRSLQVRA
ncbi:hypothetical protein Cci01nite_83250 [Catellatospora citrea]|uniref:Uncharacterized protein n=1 Tax=Catellatospora citrea TaxID=53366 RepID=A0A8J3KNR2_9ACTN|nr:hypothetical protein Cci01nite_83250 [Catellatospora citrea]